MIEYVGIPYVIAGRDIDTDEAPLDCWGLILKIYKELYNISLPHYTDINTNLTFDEASNLLVMTEVHNDFVEVEEARQGDLVLFNIFGNPLHIGLALDNKFMIHADTKCGSIVESFRSRKWQTRLYKIYRHKGKM